MSYFKGLKLTKLGETLLANINGNLNETLTFTSGEIGAGIINSDDEIRFLTTLKEKWKDLDIISIEKDEKDETIVKLELQFSNIDLKEAKIFREIGIYAKGNNGEPVLFAYSNAGENYDYIPLPQDNPQNFTIQINLKITSNSKIDAIINMAGFVTIGKMVEFLKSKLTQIPTVKELQSRKNLKIGDIVEVLGYYSAGDGANHKRIIKTEDDGSGVQLVNGLYANILHNGEVNTSWFGIKDDESIDDTPTFNKILNYVDNILVDRNVNVDKVVLPSNKTIYGKKISAVQIQLGYKCTVRDISLFPKETVEDTPFIYINGNEFPTTKAEILIKDIFIPGKELDRRNRDFFVTEISDNNGLWGITVDGVRSEQRMNFRTIFKFKAHKSKSNTSYYPWITYITIKNVSIIGGINMLELLTYYTEDGEYGYISDSKGAGLEVKINDCHFESNGLVLTMLRLGNCASVNMDNTIIGDFFEYDVDTSKYFILDNRNRKSFYDCEFYGPVEDWELTEKRYTNIHFLDSNNKIDMFGYNFSFRNYTTNQELPKKDVFDMLNRFYEFHYNYFTTTEHHFIIAKFPKKDISSYVLLTYILTNTDNESTHNVNFFSFACHGDISDSKINTNLTTLKSLCVYEKGEDYYLVLKATKDNRFNTHICTAFLISRRWYSYFWKGQQEEFNALGLTLTKEITISNAAQISQLNTLYHSEKMKQEGVYNDYITYMDDKNLYNKEQEKLEEQRYLAYQEMLKESPNLSYEEFISIQPMTLNLIEEPKPSQALQEFMKKYL